MANPSKHSCTDNPRTISRPLIAPASKLSHSSMIFIWLCPNSQLEIKRSKQTIGYHHPRIIISLFLPSLCNYMNANQPLRCIYNLCCLQNLYTRIYFNEEIKTIKIFIGFPNVLPGVFILFLFLPSKMIQNLVNLNKTHLQIFMQFWS